MNLYRLTIQLCSPLITPLKGDTIWGHIVWGIANHEGDESVATFLQREQSEEPELVVSSAFPSGLICRPIPEPRAREEKMPPEKYTANKKEKKIKFIPASTYFSETQISDSNEGAFFTGFDVGRTTINRATDTALEGESYSVKEWWPHIKEWDMYITSSLTPERIQTLFEWAFENGYGADASSGRGRITVSGPPQKVSTLKNGLTYMALGPFVQNPGIKITALRAALFLRSGKIGGAFATSLHPYKKTVLLYDEGAVFTLERERPYIGALLTGMHGADKRICQSGFAPLIPIE